MHGCGQTVIDLQTVESDDVTANKPGIAPQAESIPSSSPYQVSSVAEVERTHNNFTSIDEMRWRREAWHKLRTPQESTN